MKKGAARLSNQNWASFATNYEELCHLNHNYRFLSQFQKCFQLKTFMIYLFNAYTFINIMFVNFTISKKARSY